MKVIVNSLLLFFLIVTDAQSEETCFSKGLTIKIFGGAMDLPLNLYTEPRKAIQEHKLEFYSNMSKDSLCDVVHIKFESGPDAVKYFKESIDEDLIKFDRIVCGLNIYRLRLPDFIKKQGSNRDFFGAVLLNDNYETLVQVSSANKKYETNILESFCDSIAETGSAEMREMGSETIK